MSQWIDISEPDADGWRFVECKVCGKQGRSPFPHAKIHCACGGTLEGKPGTTLAALIKLLGLTRKEGCGCDAMIAKMDAWGPDGCHEHRTEIVEHLRTAYDHTTWTDKIKAGAAALSQGLPLTIEGLADEAICRSERAAVVQPD